MIPQTALHPSRIEQRIEKLAQDGLYGPHSTLPASAQRASLYPEHGRYQHTGVLTSAQYTYHTQPHPSLARPYQSNDDNRSSLASSQSSSEHMLRRKTPNGTLAAGYDGTPVQWSTKPPAPKHMAIPFSSYSSIGSSGTNRYKNDRMPPQELRDPHRNLQSYNTQLQGLQGPHFDRVDGGSAHDWTRLPPFLNSGISKPGGPSQHAYPHFRHNSTQIPIVLQPPYQPCIGPTASNDGGLYGPYWPDGRFVPYRPAAVRDTGFYKIVQSPASNQMLPLLPEYQSKSYQRLGSNMHDFTSSTGYYQMGNSTNNSSVEYGAPSTQQTSPTNTHALYHSTQQGNHKTLRSQAFGSPHDAQFKEKVLTWAHSVHVDLLAFLHESKKSDRHARRNRNASKSYSQTRTYPQLSKQHSPNILFGHRADLVPSSKDRTAIDLTKESFNESASSCPSKVSPSSSHPPSGNLDDQWLFNPTTPSGSRSGQNRGALITQDSAENSSTSYPLTKTRHGAIDNAKSALDMLTILSQESGWRWIDGMLLGGCLAYGLEEYQIALEWYSKIIKADPSHVEAISNLAATLLSLNRREEAEQHWLQSVKLRPSYFEAVEHLIGLLCTAHRGAEAVNIIEFVERSLRISYSNDSREEYTSDTSSDGDMSSSESTYVSSDHGTYDFDHEFGLRRVVSESKDDLARQPGFGSSGYAIPGSENGRMLALVHAKGNMLYALGDVAGASRAFEDAVLISAGRRMHGIRGLIESIHYVVSLDSGNPNIAQPSSSVKPPILLPPDKALRTAPLVFSKHGQLPGLQYVAEGIPKNAAVSTTSNSLLSLAKIFQDGMSNSQSLKLTHTPSGVSDILALYYLSLSLQPSPSTANNVGILLAGLPQPPISSNNTQSIPSDSAPAIPGVVPGSGVALALAYYNYGLNLDSRHAHLYTNLGSLLKDIGQLTAAIKMYEQAVSCDANFDIALANLANAVKDQGRISDAITYYKRAIATSPDFSEAVCGLANALNSVCDWTGRGGVIFEGGRFDRWHVDENGMLCDAQASGTGMGWMKRVVSIVGKQLRDGSNWGRGVLEDKVLQVMLHQLEIADTGDRWTSEKAADMQARLTSWSGTPWEGARIVRLIERGVKKAMHRWYMDKWVKKKTRPLRCYIRTQIPSTLSTPGAPTVLPFHTFTCPLSAKDIRMISQRNALRISCATLRAPWLPASVYPPPPPPNPSLNIGYVSSDFNNHPLAHLMQSVFGMHDPEKAKAFCYATTPSDRSVHRQQIEREAPVFHDASGWSPVRLVQQIVQDEIHILINLNGYTRGAKNEVFAARPAPIQMSFMGFAGTLGAEWCDYLLADETAIPPETLRPFRRNIDLDDQLCDEIHVEEENWVYSENIIFCRDTFFCCDHKQSSQDAQLPWPEEQQRRWKMRKEIFPDLSDDAIILGNFNQLYKIEPTTFRTWLRILAKVPKAILWLLRFPDLGESNLRRTARLWAGDEVASRITFTDVAPKNQHISRARVCDLFLDTPECNAHTTAADILWSSTPLLTLPRYKYKMCSRMAASILKGALPKSDEGHNAELELIASDEEQYEEFAVKLARGLVYSCDGEGSGRLVELRKLLYESRRTSALFDTKRWVRDLELAYAEAWRRWVEGIGGDIYL